MRVINRLLILVFFLLMLMPQLCGQNKAKRISYCADLTMDSMTRFLLKEAGAWNYCKNGKLNLEDYDALSNQVLSYFENNGFPFTEVKLDSVKLTRDSASVRLTIDKHEYIVFDSVVIQGNAKISKSYIYPYLNWRKGRAYKESVVAAVPSKIAELPFVTSVQPASVEFVNDKCLLYLFLDKRKTNQFDGYIGIVPVDERTGKVSVNGELSLDLRNIFKIGERMAVQWRSTERYSQYLQLDLNFPYLFRTPLGINGQFVLDKKDTSYLNMNYELGLQYSFFSMSYLKAYIHYTSSNVLNYKLLSVDTSLSCIDYHKMMYGLEFSYHKLDYLYNPRKGFSVLLNGSAGQRNIVKNAKAPEGFYNNLEMKKMNYNLQADIRAYIPLYKRWVFALGLNGATLFGKNHYMNELYRIGGMNSLQGFDEKAIYCSSYVIALAEVRFLFAKRSYINAFFNGAWYERQLVDSYAKDWPFGFGLGLSFDTKAGMFYLSYALGKQQNSPISFKTGKIHFGVKVGF